MVTVLSIVPHLVDLARGSLLYLVNQWNWRVEAGKTLHFSAPRPDYRSIRGTVKSAIQRLECGCSFVVFVFLFSCAREQEWPASTTLTIVQRRGALTNSLALELPIYPPIAQGCEGDVRDRQSAKILYNPRFQAVGIPNGI